jgi:isocitrate dehydrogenase (NAD+)
MYTGIEFEMGTAETQELIRFVGERSERPMREDTGISVKTISEFGSERIVRFAFELAVEQGRRLITAGHKANIMKFTDGLFLEVARRLAGEFPQVAFEERIIDALCMQLVQSPERFDVLVLPNFYGDVVSDVAAGLIGGLGVAPGGHLGDAMAVFEATHGTAPHLAGTNRADPVGVMLSAGMMLRHIGEPDARAGWTRRSPRCWRGRARPRICVGATTAARRHDPGRRRGHRRVVDPTPVRIGRGRPR